MSEKFALAGIAENYFLKDLVPKEAFSLHQRAYQDFSQMMSNEGELVPEWFSPYRGEEFRYAPAIGPTIANPDQYFFGIFGETASSMAHIFDHERGHYLQSCASALAKDSQEEGFSSEEVYTECLALLIRYQADPLKAINSEEIKRTSYGRGVEELLKVLLEVDRFSGKTKTGAKLLFRGLTQGAETKPKRPLEPLEEYYDQNKVGGETSFSQRMAAFSDERRIYITTYFSASEESPNEEIKKVIDAINYEELRKKDNQESEEYFIKCKERFRDNPTALIEAGYRDKIEDFILEKVMANEASKNELEVMVESIYRQYLESVKNWLEKTGKMEVSPGGEAALSAKNQ